MSPDVNELSISIEAQLPRRALTVVPGGMTGHLNAAALPPGYPQYFERGQGFHIWDVDGHECIDFMCSWGPNLLGHSHLERVGRCVRDGIAAQAANHRVSVR